MAKIRAYKLAEELGIDRNDIVEKAESVGVELKSPMASLDDDTAALLREKLGGGAERRRVVEEERVQRKGGGAVIRRRKKAAPEPPPEPEPAPAPPAEAEAAPESEREAEPAEPEPVPPPEPEPTPEPIQPAPREEAPRPAAQRTESAPAPPEDRKGRQRKRVREVVNLREQEQIARQATSRGTVRRQVTIDPRAMSSPRRRRRDAPAPRPAQPTVAPRPQKRVIRVEGTISLADLARELGAKAPELQGKLMALGIMVSMNQGLDATTAARVAESYGFEVQDVGFKEQEYLEPVEEEIKEEDLELRPPVITVMGHVDHGKTSILDAIRKTQVVAGEAGGITQHIGAYQVAAGDRRLTFIDTPGHEAFTEMRARGAQATDLVVLVIAATEGMMPQTVEAKDHAQAAGVPIIVAINKCDLPDANPQQARQRLMEHNLVPEDFGGDTICVNVSAKTGEGLDQLLEMIALQAEVLELRADPRRRAQGIVLEARLDKGRGPVATVLVQQGTLHPGDAIVVGTAQGRVRAMEDENGKRVKEAGPSTPVQVVGLSDVPEAGQVVHAVESERVAKDIVAHRRDEQREQPAETRPRLSLEEMFAQAEGGGPKELPIVLKADVQGSVEAVRDALLKLSTDEVEVNVIHSGVGAVTENDVMLAKASGAVVVAFHVRPDPAARKAAEGQGVDVRSYRVIYEATDEIQKAMAGLLPPKIQEAFLGRAEVRQTFQIPRVGMIAGCHVTEGRIRRNASCRLVRDGVQIYEGRIGSLKRFKEDAREVQSGFECGIGIDGYGDVKVGDVIEAFVLEEHPATL